MYSLTTNHTYIPVASTATKIFPDCPHYQLPLLPNVMAPVPADNSVPSNTDLEAKPRSGYWSKANIALTTIFATVFLALFLAALTFCIYRRNQRRKLNKRKPDVDGLLANEDKTHMFSRNIESNVTLYVDSEAEARNKRASTASTHLVPLQVTPVEETKNPIDYNTESSGTGPSTGTGVSSMSRHSSGTLSTMVLSPVLSPTVDEGDLGVRPGAGRPRSTSTASQRARYYERTPTNVDIPPIPRIVHTPSE